MSEEFEDKLATLEATQKRGRRIMQRSVLINMGALLLLAAVNAALAMLAPAPWQLRGLICVGGLTTLGLMGHVYAVRLVREIVQRDAELLKRFRQELALTEAVNEVRPLMDAIVEAHAHGASLMVIPPDAPPPPDEKTVH